MAINGTSFNVHAAYGGVAFARITNDAKVTTQVLVTRDEWVRFVQAVKDGKLDDILTEQWNGYDEEVLAFLASR